MAQESFYGGRQGASFVIVKRFDAVYLDSEVKKVVEYAVEKIDDQYYYILDSNENFIIKSYQNEDDYLQKNTRLDGNNVNISGGGTKTLPNESQEGLVNCFRQGGATTQEVNYGEYVIIDCPNSPDNGRVYRRGMNYNGAINYIDPNDTSKGVVAEDPGAGAEYIGQICGPEGKIKELEIGNYDESKSTGEYTPTEVVSGFDHNGIKYSWENVKDIDGRIQGYIIGFQFPYFVQEWTAVRGDPYVLPEHLIRDVTGSPQTERPWYRKYEMTIPRGLPGSKIEQAGAIPVGVRGGSKLYTSPAFSPEGTKEIVDDEIYGFNSVQDFSTIGKQVCFKIEGVNQYAKFENCIAWHSALNITTYNDTSSITKWTDGGLFNYIEEMVVADNTAPKGYTDHLLVYYSDPDHREAFASKKVRQNNRDYVDLGYVRGQPGTSPIMGEIDTLDRIGTPTLDPTIRTAIITPEALGGDYSFKGQVVVQDDNNPNGKQVQAYDYRTGPNYVWRYIGRFAGGGGNGFVISPTMPADLGVGGVWGKTELIECFPLPDTNNA